VLSNEQLTEFAAEGYIVLPGAVGEDLLRLVDAEIDALSAADPPPAQTTGQHFYFLTPDQLPACDMALRESGALHTAEGLVAPHRLDHGLDHIQVALNIPPFSHRPGGPHIDGNGPDQLARGRPDSFTMLAAIYLVDELVPDVGNLWVWPRSHLMHQQLFRDRGVNALLQVGGHATMLDPPLVFSEQRAVFAKRGDLLLAHYLLGHNIGGNVGERVRRIVYYRLSCEGHAERRDRTLREAFTEYEPVARALGSPPD
jgi:hypothetical protein